MNPQQLEQLKKQSQASHLIPKYWRPKSSRDLIHEFFYEHLSQKVEGNKQLELEIRLGKSYFRKRKKGINPNNYAKMFRDLSI